MWGVRPHIQECIRDAAKTADITNYIDKGAELYEMQTFDSHIPQLVKEGKVDLESAKVAVTRPDELERALMLEG